MSFSVFLFFLLVSFVFNVFVVKFWNSIAKLNKWPECNYMPVGFVFVVGPLSIIWFPVWMFLILKDMVNTPNFVQKIWKSFKQFVNYDF